MISGQLFLWLAVFAVILFVVSLLGSKLKFSFGITVFASLILGSVLGLSLYRAGNEELTGEVRKWFSLIGYGYVDLLRMLIVPLVPASIIAGILKLKDRNELKELGGRTIGLFLITASIASIIGIAVASLMHIGAGVGTEGLAPKESSTVGSLLVQIRGFIPSNPFKSAADTQMIPLVVFALFIGIAGVIESGRNPERVEPFRRVLESYLVIIIRVTKMVIKLTPYGVVGLMAYWMSYTGIGAVADLALFVAGVVLACVIQVFVVYSSFLYFSARINPVKFFKAAAPAMLLAFTSRSSLGTLTLTVSTMENRLKVKSRVAHFVGPIGAVMNMDACGGIFPAMVAIFAANAFQVELSLLQYVLIALVSIVASIGSAGVPMGATAFTVITLSAVGLPVEAVGLVAGVDFLVDMFRTATNVTGDMMVSVVVADKLGELDREAFEAGDYGEEAAVSL